MASEFERIARLRARYGAPPAGVSVGIGDDAAVLTPPPGAKLVWTVDEQVEGVHFERAWLSFEDIGYRAFMAAASNLAAMGAEPYGALSSLALPRDLPESSFDALTAGLAEAAAIVGAPIVGGNLTRGPVVSVSTTLLGTAPRPLVRSGARPGDVVLLAGPVGLAAAALRSLLARAGSDVGSGSRAAAAGGATEAEHAEAFRAFRRPRARIAEGLRAAPVATAAIDVSDGLVQDIGHLAEASGVAFVLDVDAVLGAAGSALVLAARAFGVDPLALALGGGEDYALVVTAASPIEGFVAIGRVEEGSGVRLRWPDGREEAARASGFNHYATS